MITDKELYGRKLEGILGVFLAVIFLCITAESQTMMPSAEEEPADYLNIAEGLTGDLRLIPEMNEGSRSENGLTVLTDNPLSKIFELPRIPETAGSDMESIAAAIEDEPSIPGPEAVITPEESELVSDDRIADDRIADDRIADEEIPPVSDDAEEGMEPFTCGGFLCDPSGMIIGCQDAAVTDGVLCLPLEKSCTGIAAGALDSLGAEVYEIYIPQNIVSIEEGAFDGLTGLLFIEVHPGNPAYGSSEGMLYKK